MSWHSTRFCKPDDVLWQCVAQHCVLAVVGKDELVWCVPAGKAAAAGGERGLLAKDGVQGLARRALQCYRVVDLGGDGEALQAGNIVVQDSTSALPNISLGRTHCR